MTWLRTLRATTIEMSRPMLCSIYTVKNGDARLTAKFQEPRKMTRFLKLRSANGFLIVAKRPASPPSTTIRGSGVRARNTIPMRPAMRPKRKRAE